MFIQLKDFGTIDQALDSSVIDFDIQGKFGVEVTMFDFYKRVLWVCELFVLEDASSEFTGRILGMILVPLTPDMKQSAEVPIYFQNPTYLESFIQKWKSNEAEHLPASSALIQISQQEPNTMLDPKGYLLDPILTTKQDDLTRQYLKKQQRTPCLTKISTIYENLKTMDTSFDPPRGRDAVLRDLRQRVVLLPSGYFWASSKYLMPYEVSNKKVYVKIEGFLNLDQEILFCRFLVNPDARGRKRPIYNPGFPNFETSNIAFQVLRGQPVLIEIPAITDKHAVLIEVLRVVYDPDRPKNPKVMPAGIAMYPLRNDDGYLTVGRALLPVFDPGLDWETIEEFSKFSIMEMYQTFYEQEQDIGITNSFVFLTVTDEYRSVANFSSRTCLKTSLTSRRLTLTM